MSLLSMRQEQTMKIYFCFKIPFDVLTSINPTYKTAKSKWHSSATKFWKLNITNSTTTSKTGKKKFNVLSNVEVLLSRSYREQSKRFSTYLAKN